MNRLRNKQLEGTILVCFAPQRWTAAVRRPPMRRPCFTLQEATMGIWSNYFVGHSAAVFEVLLHNSPLQAPPHHVHVRRVGPTLSFKGTDLRAEGNPPPTPTGPCSCSCSHSRRHTETPRDFYLQANKIQISELLSLRR